MADAVTCAEAVPVPVTSAGALAFAVATAFAHACVGSIHGRWLASCCAIDIVIRGSKIHVAHDSCAASFALLSTVPMS
jgi:hypothetical protein